MDASQPFMLNFVVPKKREELISYARFGDQRSIESLLPRGYPRKKAKTKATQKKQLSRREIKELGLYAIPHDTVKYKDVLPLHRMWCEYISTLFTNPPDVTSVRYNSFVASLLKADYHGAEISIVRSKQSSFVGLEGIVILDTKGTFKIVSRDDKVRTIPKEESLFEIHFNDTVISIFGKFLKCRPAERSVRKMKLFSIPDL